MGRDSRDWLVKSVAPHDRWTVRMMQHIPNTVVAVISTCTTLL